MVSVDTMVNLNRAQVQSPVTNGTNLTTISGNGSFSSNDATLNNNQVNSAFQTNRADIRNDIHSSAKTGENDANRNTGGDVTVVTGHALNDVAVRNAANANLFNATAPAATVGTSTTDSLISGNGSASSNSITLNQNHSTSLVQNNDARIRNYVDAYAKTGHNDANDNTGGSNRVDTGNAQSLVTVDNLANFNVANDDSFASTAFNKIASNGSFSDSTIRDNQNNVASIFQGGQGRGNLFDLNNRVNATPASGYNDLNRNTAAVLGDDQVLVTGHAVSDTMVRNAGNANVYGSTTGLTLPGGTNLNFMFDLGSLFGNSLL